MDSIRKVESIEMDSTSKVESIEMDSASKIVSIEMDSFRKLNPSQWIGQVVGSIGLIGDEQKVVTTPNFCGDLLWYICNFSQVLGRIGEP